ncbi:hypothetical protein DERP_003240 [Dermatophagoides pteronyssinus]|uniref:Uncharacterized protein n=1 Tax=Dermatophagoides pteronyssinus TaxID=6956 RepID=A0ABQ8JIY0_DERPT|nr:hypothetical protein DERP_003240 [Dermatophagoides pteronyssinus]
MKSIFFLLTLMMIVVALDASGSQSSPLSLSASLSKSKRLLLIQIVQSLAHRANESGLAGDQIIFETAGQLLQTKDVTDDDQTQILSFLQLQLMGQMMKKETKK